MRRCLAVVGMLEQVGPSAAPGYAATPWPLTRQYLVVCERRYRGVPPWLFGLGQEDCPQRRRKPCRSKVPRTTGEFCGDPTLRGPCESLIGVQGWPRGMCDCLVVTCGELTRSSTHRPRLWTRVQSKWYCQGASGFAAAAPRSMLSEKATDPARRSPFREIPRAA